MEVATMHRVMALMMTAGGMLATGAVAQTVAPPPPMQHGRGLMRADANHDGTITRAEMIADAETRFAAMDADKDGKVTAAERDAARAAMRARRRDGATGGPDGGPRGGGGGGFGMRGDPDGDAVLTRADAVQRAGKRFDRLDTNHDGKLDAAEMAAGRPMRGARQAGAMPPLPAAAAQPQ
ncbi:hypothetical protein GCM10009102_15180 [Sphingomonas insulae]|uniref:EF-hand domain-containing protein n=3 Tax=Sphingomonas insulae TaxID=424800 RepID=A0ABP3SYX2_9SPHN